MATTRRSIIWVDAHGSLRLSILTGNASLAAVQGQLLLLSNADFQMQWEGPLAVNPMPAPANLQFPNVADYAVLLYTDGVSDVYITVPAPKGSMFLPDNETVNPASVAGLTAAVVGTVLTGSGLPVVAYVAGVRRRATKEYQ